MSYQRPNSHLYGGYNLDDSALKVMQVFVERLWQNYIDKTPIPREFQYPSDRNDWRQKIYFRIYRDFAEGKVDYVFDVDTESLQMASPAHLSALTRKFTRYKS